MAESSNQNQVSSNPETSSNFSRKKRRKLSPAPDTAQPKWKSETEQQIYSSKLVDALIHLRRPETPRAAGRAFRDAADKVLATSAKGRTRWSRAILTGRLSLRLAQINRKHKKAVRPGSGETRARKPAVQKKLPPVQKKVKVLSRLVPGCRKISLPNLLEETSDYIAALEMQVKAMTFLTSLLNGSVNGAIVDAVNHQSSPSSST